MSYIGRTPEEEIESRVDEMKEALRWLPFKSEVLVLLEHSLFCKLGIEGCDACASGHATLARIKKAGL